MYICALPYRMSRCFLGPSPLIADPWNESNDTSTTSTVTSTSSTSTTSSSTTTMLGDTQRPGNGGESGGDADEMSLRCPCISLSEKTYEASAMVIYMGSRWDLYMFICYLCICLVFESLRDENRLHPENRIERERSGRTGVKHGRSCP